MDASSATVVELDARGLSVAPGRLGGRTEAVAGEDGPASGCSLEARFERLASEVGPLAFGVALRMLGERAEAEDALQDAFAQAFRALPGFRGEASLRTWFLRILVNCCRRRRRVWRGLVRGGAGEALEAPEPAVADVHGDPALRARLDAAVLVLSHRQRAAFVLRYVHDLGIDEIAEVMGCAPGTVKATVHKAVAKLRRELGDLA